MKLSVSEVSNFYSTFIETLFFAGFSVYKKGAFREVYRRNKTVIKVPRNVNGVVDNLMEARAFKLYGKKPTSLGIQLAPCRLLENCCLMMPFVLVEDWSINLPEWVSMVEGDQVGRYKGRLVAYDYALDLSERYAWEKESCLKSEFFQNNWKNVKPFLYPPETFVEYKDVVPPNIPIGKLVCPNNL